MLTVGNRMPQFDVPAVVSADPEKAFEQGATFDVEALRNAGLIRGRRRVKVLGNGDIKKKFTVHADKFSASAKTKIEAAGGTCQEIK